MAWQNACFRQLETLERGEVETCELRLRIFICRVINVRSFEGIKEEIAQFFGNLRELKK